MCDFESFVEIFFSFQNNPNTGRTIMMNQQGRVTTPTGNQKIVFLTQRSQTSGNTIQTQQNPQAQSTVVKFVSNSTTQNTQKLVTTQQKLVVVGMPNSNSTTTVSQGNSQSVTQMGLMNQSNQQNMSVMSKSFMQQQQQQKLKEQLSAPAMDDLSHLT